MQAHFIQHIAAMEVETVAVLIDARQKRKGLKAITRRK